MCARVADALYFAHQRGIIHRDIKPANVVFDQKNRRVRVMDFGVARLVDSRATRTGVILGSPSYMAPEQLDARPVTAQSDLFSLGVTLFQLLTGMLPFRSDSIPGLMQKISAEPHPPLRVVRPDLPASLSAVIDRALEKDPAMRYRSGAEMAQALRDAARETDPALR
jgi:serine/threonine-protein kinase